jgi:Short C-terminal domain
MPGLIRGVARTAVIAGTATAVSNRVSRRQANRWAQQEEQQYGHEQVYYQQPPPGYYQQPPAPAPAPAAAPAKDTVTQLKELAELKSQGLLSDTEFEALKAKILAT